MVIQNLKFDDPYFEMPYLSITSCLEPLLGIVNASLPVLQPTAGLLRAHFSSIASMFPAQKARDAGKMRSTGGRSSKTGQSDRSHFHRGRDDSYLWTDTGVDVKSQTTTTCTAVAIELESRITKDREGEDTIKLTTALEWPLKSDLD